MIGVLVIQGTHQIGMAAPIAEGVKAERFRPVYSMHRYFARRPHNLFQRLVEHYSEPGDVVLDPFFGGGVAIVESLLSGRRAIGCDINPMAGFITRMEIADFEVEGFDSALSRLIERAEASVYELFSSTCPECGSAAHAKWIEVSAEHECSSCNRIFRVAQAEKAGIGAWSCPECASPNRLSVTADTRETPVLVLVECSCGFSGHKSPDDLDLDLFASMLTRLREAEDGGLWLPSAPIPECNMERESALHKKGIDEFRKLFSPRVLLAWGLVRRAIELERDPELRMWMWFTFSAALRYSNRMVSRNPGWRGDKPLEWAKPGYWLPPVYLEVDPLDQLKQRAAAIRRAKSKTDGRAAAGRRCGTAGQVVDGHADYCVDTRSSTHLPIADSSVDLVLTDPPYGSYVHYADLTNFWAVWLPDYVGPGLGDIMDTTEEAVIARKRFSGAKTPSDYQRLLEAVFAEAFRVLRPGGYMVLTFNNREPRAWFALLSAADRAGFSLPDDGVIFQDGIKSYEHTAQSRRAGSVIGDFVYSFHKSVAPRERPTKGTVPSRAEMQDTLVHLCEEILVAEGPLPPRDLFTRLYLRCQPQMAEWLHLSGSENHAELLRVADEIVILDSHRREDLLRHFDFENGVWRHRIRHSEEMAVTT